MFHRWFSQKAQLRTPEEKAKDAFEISWDWLWELGDVKKYTAILGEHNRLFNLAAQKELTRVLKRNGFLEKSGEFDFTIKDREYWKKDSFQSMPCFSSIPFYVTGLAAALDRFNIAALAKGNVTVDSTHTTICVTAVSVFVSDSFDFEGKQYLGKWDCEEKTFNLTGIYNVFNSSFRDFREEYEYGNDFLVYSSLFPIDIHDEFCYNFTKE